MQSTIQSAKMFYILIAIVAVSSLYFVVPNVIIAEETPTTFLTHTGLVIQTTGDGSERLQEAFDNWWYEGRTEESCHRWDWFEENGWGDHIDTKYIIRDGIDIDGYDTSPLWLKNRKKLMGK